MNYILFDEHRHHLLPLTYTRPVSEIRLGILTITEKWQHMLSSSFSFLTEDYLSEKYPSKLTNDNLWINGSICPDKSLVQAITSLELDQCLKSKNSIISYRSKSNTIPTNVIEYPHDFFQLKRLHEIFTFNQQFIHSDFKLITNNRTSQPISTTNQIIAPERIFLEEGAVVEYATLNASNGPIYIGREAEVMEGSLVRGSLAMCDHSVLKMGAKIYGATTLGPYSKVGGEVNNSVLLGYSNKGHDGFLGNSVIGEWCNLGADTNNSNLKNNYANVKLWNYSLSSFEDTGLQFCGLIMGDHSKCGINTMFNTGTVIGVSANIFGAGIPRQFVPSFSWGGASGYSTYQLNKSFEVAEKVMQRRAKKFDTMEQNLLKHVFELSKKYRNY